MLNLKSLHIQPPVIQSPMSGWTDLPFRLIAREKGLGFAFLEMVLADAVVAGSVKTFDRMKSTPDDRPLGAQLVGYTPESLADAAAILEEAGFDLIDLNLGCPVKKVTCKGGGSAILREPDRAKEIFLRMVGAVRRVPITVKMRLGYDDPSGAEALRIAEVAEECGVSGVTIHGRTRSQGYSGQADYEAIGRIKRAVGIPVIGNGDVVNAPAARRLLDVSGCDGVMIGRGGIGYPWIYREIAAACENRPLPAPPAFDEIKQTLLRHLDFQVRDDAGSALFVMRRVSCGYFKNCRGAVQFRERVNAAVTTDELRRIIEGFQPLVPLAALPVS